MTKLQAFVFKLFFSNYIFLKKTVLEDELKTIEKKHADNNKRNNTKYTLQSYSVAEKYNYIKSLLKKH